MNSNALIDKNDITITGSANVADADLYGGYADNTQATISDNSLTLNGWSGSVNSVNNFSDIYINNFTLNTNLINVGSVSGMKGVTIHLGAFTATKDDFKINAGDYAVGYNVKAAEIKWDSKLGSNVDFTAMTFKLLIKALQSIINFTLPTEPATVFTQLNLTTQLHQAKIP